MSPDTFIEYCESNYSELQQKHYEKGFTGESFDAVCCKMSQAWRLVCGAEPSRYLMVGQLPAHMRYAPYR
jgi:hypothetical protein